MDILIFQYKCRKCGAEQELQRSKHNGALPIPCLGDQRHEPCNGTMVSNPKPIPQRFQPNFDRPFYASQYHREDIA